MTSDLLNQLDQIIRNYMLIGAAAYIILPVTRSILILLLNVFTGLIAVLVTPKPQNKQE